MLRSSPPTALAPTAFSRTQSMTAGMSGKFNRRSRNAVTATSFAALRMAGASPPVSATRPAQSKTGEAARVGREEVQLPGLEQIQEVGAGLDAFRPGHAVRNRRTHVR